MNEPPAESNQDCSGAPPHDRVLPAEQVFLSDAAAPALVMAGPAEIAHAPPVAAARRPGPGFFESIAWMIGMYGVQLGTIVLVSVVIFARAVLMNEIDASRSGAAELFNKLLALFREDLFAILGASQAATIVYGLLAIRLRIRPHGVRRLGWKFPWHIHWLLVALLMPPMWFLSSSLQDAMLKWMPWAEAGMKDLEDALAQAPLWLCVLVIGLQPAVAEELVFRGLIGRGLVARWGLVPGMLVTSILFGVMHLHPVQAIGVIPLGLAIHFTYLTARSFWAPMTLHLLNNLLSVILVKLRAGRQLDNIVEANSEPTIPMLVSSLSLVIAIALLLWQTRVQYVLSNGSVWNPGFTSAESPPSDVKAVAMHHQPGSLLLTGTVLGGLGFLAALWGSTAS